MIEDRAIASLRTDSILPKSSPTVDVRTNSIPFSARQPAIQAEFVSTICPKRSSDPIAMISAFILHLKLDPFTACVAAATESHKRFPNVIIFPKKNQTADRNNDGMVFVLDTHLLSCYIQVTLRQLPDCIKSFESFRRWMECQQIRKFMFLPMFFWNWG